MSRHTSKFVQPGEFWTLYWTMIVGAIFWGSFWSVLAWKYFRFNREALAFLSFLTILSALCLGITLYFRLRMVLKNAEDRVTDRDLEIF